MITLKLQFDEINGKVLTISTNYGWAEYSGEQAEKIYNFLEQFVDLIDDDFDNVEYPPDETE